MKLRLGNNDGGMSAKAVRALYTEAIRTIITWGAELWNRPDVEPELEHEIPGPPEDHGAYHGSYHTKLLNTAHIEPLEVKLDDVSISWAAKEVLTNHPASNHAQGTSSWHHGSPPPPLRF